MKKIVMMVIPFVIILICIITYLNSNKLKVESNYVLNTEIMYGDPGDAGNGETYTITITDFKVNDDKITVYFKQPMLRFVSYTFLLLEGNRVSGTTTYRDDEKGIMEVVCKKNCSEYDGIVLYDTLRERQMAKIDLSNAK